MGDLHGALGRLRGFFHYGKHDDTLLICVGDIEMGIMKESMVHRVFTTLDKRLSDINSHVILMRGNHDDPYYWSGVDAYTNIKFIDNEYIYTNNRLMLLVGGAVSVDRAIREEGHDWWRGEGVNYDFIDKVIETDRKHEVDYLITHASYVFPPALAESEGFLRIQKAIDAEEELSRELREEREHLKRLVDYVNPGTYVHGHYHSRERHSTPSMGIISLGEQEYFKANNKA